MRIGILTYHRAHNYGAVLQCYALQEYLKRQVHDVEVIDYRQPHIESYYRNRFTFRKLLGRIYHLDIPGITDLLGFAIKDYNRKRRFHGFCEKFLNASAPCSSANIPQDYDRYIIGSDQMWGLHCTGGYDPIYWGNFKRKLNSKLYGYAISSNGDYCKYLSDDHIKENASNFSGLSFREETILRDFVSRTGIHATVAIDPTLLSDEEIWQPMLRDKWANRKYIALYNIRGHALDIRHKAEELAKKLNLDIIDLSTMEYDVEDFVSVIKYATCVYTSSFHATVFSIIFGTPFYAFCLNDGHDGRYVNLVSNLGLGHLIQSLNQTQISIPRYNKEKVNRTLSELRQPSRDFIIKKILKE